MKTTCHPHQTKNEILINALRTLANDIISEDGVANACIFEAADRIEELCLRVEELENQQSLRI